MPKKNPPIFQKVSTNLLNMSIFLAKMKKPIITRLISLKETKKMMKMKKISLLKHYNYRYIQEYQFSPSNTPLLQFYNRKDSPRKQRSYRDFCSSVFLISKCLGIANGEGGEKRRRYPVLELEGLGSMEDGRELLDVGNEDEDDNNSVDERSEKFIERFYEEIKLQRQASFLKQFNAMVDN
ncbi:hypothetical protein T459_14525 [Capsicum annuum]|uniref:Cotton fiber protein n=1 Tax=Capsicum annuum TaxID=4072 RepID=A0A1U8H2M4_CAPAN|nr:uncharacterized protein LOC107872491 [Capsicum annuum]PHT81510.1 hypothetical protein T459_14525 [Capsicum annuum]